MILAMNLTFNWIADTANPHTSMRRQQTRFINGLHFSSRPKCIMDKQARRLRYENTEGRAWDPLWTARWEGGRGESVSYSLASASACRCECLSTMRIWPNKWRLRDCFTCRLNYFQLAGKPQGGGEHQGRIIRFDLLHTLNIVTL